MYQSDVDKIALQTHYFAHATLITHVHSLVLLKCV